MTEIGDTTPTLDEAPTRRLVRTREGRWLAGVASGLGRTFDVNPLLYRIAFVALAFAGGTGLVLYVAAWLVIPDEGEEESIATEALRDHREQPWLLVGVGLLGLAGILLLSEASVWPGPGNVWLAAVLAGAALVWWHVGGRERKVAAEPGAPPAERPARRPSLLGPVVGLLLAGAGLLGLLDVLDAVDVDGEVALASATALVGAAVVGGAFAGRRVGGLVVLGVALLLAFGTAAASPVSLRAGIGERVEHPFTASDLESEYELGIGDFTVELDSVALEPGRTNVDVRLGIGDLVITVPEGVGLEVDGHAGAGSVDVLGHEDDGAGADEHVIVPPAEPGGPVLVLDANVGVGDLAVRIG
jgi:phage shock protein PspC (stress-responsive transcriptional regulator)